MRVLPESAWCVLMAALAGCSSGSGSDGGRGPSGSGGPWLAYSGGGVFALDLSARAAPPVTLDPSSNVGGLRTVESGTYSAATGAVSGVQPHSAIWISGGRILRAGVAAGTAPSSAQVSSESSVGDPSPLNPTPNHLCDTAVVVDWATLGDSRFFYTLAGSDRHCGGTDDVVKSTRLTSPSGEAPITLPGRRVSEIRSPSTGAITGWLLIDGTSRLVRTDASFANPLQLAASVGFAFVVGRAPSHLLVLLQSGSQPTVRRFDSAAGTLDTTALFTLPGGIGASVGATAQDDGTAYMMVFDGSWSLYRLALDATQADSAVQMTSEAGRNVRGLLQLTTSKVVFIANAGGTDSLVAVDKTASGTTAAPALGAAQSPGTVLTLLGSAADKVYVNATASGRTARAVTEVGADAVSQANAAWVGLADVAGTRTAVLASGLSGATNFGSATVSTVVAGTGSPGITLGALPPELTTMDVLHWSGGTGLLRAFTDAQSAYGEIFFADASAAGSLLRVTNTASVSESLP